MNLTTWAWAIVPLGACRLLQILLHDRVLRGPRSWLLKKLNPRGLDLQDPERPYWSYLLECPWCLSVWSGAALVAGLLWDLTRAATLVFLLIMAVSLLAVVLDRLVDLVTPDKPLGPAPKPPPLPVPSPSIAAQLDQFTGDQTTGTG